MSFTSIMHVSFYTRHMQEMIDYYLKLGATIKYKTTYAIYLERDDRQYFQEIAKKDPDRIFNIYLELAPGQFIELFPAHENQVDDVAWNARVGYGHYALLTDDIFAKREELAQKGIMPFTEPNKGPSETWQMWYKDPDGNCFEVMQYTDKSLQVVGN